MLENINFITSNNDKLREFEDILDFKLKCSSLNIKEIQSLDIVDVAKHKASEAYNHINEPVLVEDTGLFVDIWNGFPGVFIKWFYLSVGSDGIWKMLEKFNNKKASAVTVVCLFDGVNFIIGKGEIRGVLTAPLGDNGFGWDDIFLPDGSDRTFAQMSLKQKKDFSMRRLALEELLININNNKN